MRRLLGSIGTFFGIVVMTLQDGWDPSKDLATLWTAGSAIVAAYGAMRYAGQKK